MRTEALFTILCALLPGLLLAQEAMDNPELQELQPDNREMRAISLEEVLSITGADNLLIAEMRAQREVAVAAHKQASDWLLPEVSLGVNFLQHNGYDQETTGELVDVDKNNGLAGAGASAEWDIGEAIYEKKATRKQVTASNYEVAKARRDQQMKATKAYVDMVAAQSKLATFEEMVRRSKDIAQQMDRLVEEGLRFKSDWALAKANINDLQLSLSKAKRQYMNSAHRLMRILNIDGDSVLLMSSDSVMAPLSVIGENDSVSLDSAYAERPEPRIHKYRKQALQQKRNKVTKGMLIPSVRAGAYDGYYGSTDESGGNRLNIRAGVGWDVPLGELFYRGQRKEYDARKQMESMRLQKAQNRIREEVLSAHDNLQRADQQMQLAKEQVSFAEMALRQTRERQEVGTAEPLEVFRAEEQTIKAQQNYIEAVADYNKAQYALYFALGRN